MQKKLQLEPIHACARKCKNKELSYRNQVHLAWLNQADSPGTGQRGLVSDTIQIVRSEFAAVFPSGEDSSPQDLVPGAESEVELSLHPLLGNRRKGWHGNPLPTCKRLL